MSVLAHSVNTVNTVRAVCGNNKNGGRGPRFTLYATPLLTGEFFQLAGADDVAVETGFLGAATVGQGQ